MSIKPLDLQVMIPKTPELSKIHSEENNKVIVNQQNAVTSFQHQTEHQLKQVNSTDKAYEGKIKEKQKEEKGQGKQKNSNREPKDKKRKQQEKRKDTKGSTIDILI